MIKSLGYRSLFAIIILFWSSQIAFAQSTLSQNQDGFTGETMDGYMNQPLVKDTTVVERTVSKDYSQWTIESNYGKMVNLEPDTLPHLFQNAHLTEGYDESYSYLANMGSPRLSRIFFNRERFKDFIFDAPLDFFIKNPYQFRFTDTKTPHLNLTYFKAGDKKNGEERLKGYFAANFGKKIGIGIDMDYIVGRGRYSNQSTSMFDARFYTYYHGEKYSAHASINSDEIKIAENGGIEDERYITNPEAMSSGRKQYAPEDIPVVLYYTWNNLQRKQFMLSQDLKIEKKFEISDSIGDTIYTYSDKREISTITHQLEAGSLKRRLIYHELPINYYQHDYLKNDSIDLTGNLYLNNTICLSLIEGFSKWAVAGLSVYARNEVQRFTLPDTLSTGRNHEYIKRYYKNNIFIGGRLERHTGKNLTFDINAETVVFGDIGDFNIDGKVNISFPFLKQNADFGGKATIINQEPLFYQKRYHARDCWWDNDFDKTLSVKLLGYLQIEKYHTYLSVGIENVTNYIYLTDEGAAFTNENNEISNLHDIKYKQYSGSIQVASVNLKKDFILGPLHWDNNLTYQVSGNSDILPLPQLNVFSDLYLKFAYAKRLKIELGANVTYFTKYYAPTYSPAVCQYLLQNDLNKQKVGGYPMMNAYVNCSLRGVRFYLMFYHVNEGVSSNMNSFFIPKYPLNPRMFSLGLSWTFFD